MNKHNVIVLGATGFVGGAVARHLASSQYSVTGLARSRSKDAALVAASVKPKPGDLDAGLHDVLAIIAEADSVIYAAQLPPASERRVVSAIVDTMAGTGKRFIFTSGTGVFNQRTEGAWSPDSFAEDDDFAPEPLAAGRLEAEALVRDAPSRKVDGIVLRPPLIWGPEDHGHVAMTYRSVGATGAACYVGEGLATYSNVHIDDVAGLFALALERGTPGAVYHAVGGEVPNRWIAEAVARDIGCGTRRVSSAKAAGIWGEFGALIMSSSSRSRSPRARDELGWRPRHTDMLTLIGEPRLRAMASNPTPSS